MSVEVILSSKHIQLNQHSQAVLNLKATFATVAPTISALYKIRVNSKSMLEVRPSFGVLRASNEDDAIASLNIKYTGSVENIQKVKIQVSWVWGQVPEKTFHYNEFSELYNNFKEKLGAQKSQMVDFISEKQAKQSQDSLEIQENHSSGNQSQEQLIKSQKEKNEVEKQSIVIRKTNNDGNVSLKILIMGLLLAFVLGVLVGFKLEPLIKSLQIEQNNNNDVSEKNPESELLLNSPFSQIQNNPNSEGKQNQFESIQINGDDNTEKEVEEI